jgi:hypothetical protein
VRATDKIFFEMAWAVPEPMTVNVKANTTLRTIIKWKNFIFFMSSFLLFK